MMWQITVSYVLLMFFVAYLFSGAVSNNPLRFTLGLLGTITAMVSLFISTMRSFQ